MNNHNVIEKGPYKRTSYDSNGNVTDSSLVQLTRSTDTVSGYSLVQGDKKNPTNFAYNTQYLVSYRGTFTRFSLGPGSRFYPSFVGEGIYDQNGVENRALWPNVVSFHYNKALNKLYDKVRGSLDLSIAVAERHETYRLLNALKQLEDVIKDAPRKGEFFDWRKPLRVLGGRWLQWHLAIRPLIQDIYGAADEFIRTAVPSLLEINAKSYVKCPTTLPVANKRYPNDKKESVHSDGVQGVYVAVKLRESGDFNLARWTSLNPVSIAWELLPLSFVVDYFYNVSQMLRSFESSLLYSSKFVSGYYTELYTLSMTHRETGTYGAEATQYFRIEGTSFAKITTFRRTVLSSMPSPRLPTFVVPTSWQKLVTMASLLAVRLK